MLVSKYNSTGMTLIELMIVVAILAIVSTVAVPSFSTMIINSQIRNATEAIVNGLQKARAEAVKRNVNVEFVLGTNTSWAVQLLDATNIESRSANEGSANVTRTALASDLATAATKVTFNSFGGVVATNADASAVLARVTLNAVNGTKPLRVEIGVGGDARMCDPSLATGSSPRAC
jgi:type IV fimbrial biogenesis protein FimT